MPSKIATVPAPLFAVTSPLVATARSRWPSPLKIPMAPPQGAPPLLLPVKLLVVTVSVPFSVPLATLTVPPLSNSLPTNSALLLSQVRF